jgi:hypothetical protein
MRRVTAAVRADRVLKDPAHATLARAKAETGDIVVEYDGVGFVRPPVCGQFLCRQSHLQHPFREGPGKKWEDIPVAGACGDQTVDLFGYVGVSQVDGASLGVGWQPIHTSKSAENTENVVVGVFDHLLAKAHDVGTAGGALPCIPLALS